MARGYLNMAKNEPKSDEAHVLVAIVNNHVHTVTHISNFLEGKGYRTVWAYGGKAAMALCEKERPDILILDAQMPETSGFDVARALPAQKILFMVADKGIGEKAKQFKNCVGTLHKPIDNRELDELLRSIFKLKKPEL